MLREWSNSVNIEFGRQFQNFSKDRKERPFDQNWNNDEDEIAYVNVPESETLFDDILESPGIDLESISPNDIGQIRGLAVIHKRDGSEVILIQRFRYAQLFQQINKLAFVYDRRSFVRLEAPGFHIDSKLVCIVEDNLIKFDSITNLGAIIDTSEIYEFASDPFIKNFIFEYDHLFYVSNIDTVLRNINRNSRKYISSIVLEETLERATVDAIKESAKETGLPIQMKQGKICIPESRNELSELIRFLNEGRFIGPISGNTYVTNSRRRA